MFAIRKKKGLSMYSDATRKREYAQGVKSHVTVHDLYPMRNSTLISATAPSPVYILVVRRRGCFGTVPTDYYSRFRRSCPLVRSDSTNKRPFCDQRCHGGDQTRCLELGYERAGALCVCVAEWHFDFPLYHGWRQRNPLEHGIR